MIRVVLFVPCPLSPATGSRTTEFQVLETNGVPVVAYGTDVFPAFFSPSSGVRAPLRMDTPFEVAAAARVREPKVAVIIYSWVSTHWEAVVVDVGQYCLEAC